MTVDPAAQPILDLLMAQSPDLGRSVTDAAEARRLSALRERPPVLVELPLVEDHTIPGPGGSLALRSYSPVADPSDLPLVVFFHGGGWVFGDLNSHDGLCRELARGIGAVVVAVEYRLAPEARFPAALDDAYAALAWTVEHAQELGGRADEVVVAGDSAGGNLAAAVALLARDRNGPPVAFQLLLYPSLDPSCSSGSFAENAEGYFLTASAMKWFWAQYLGDGDGASTDPYAAPLLAEDLSGLPAVHVVTCALDPLRDEGEAYASRLASAGVAVTVERLEGLFHGIFGFASVLEPARAALQRSVDAVAHALDRTRA